MSLVLETDYNFNRIIMNEATFIHLLTHSLNIY